MKPLLIVIWGLSLLAAPARAQDFDGTWRVPDEQSLAPAKCKSGDVKECLRLAWSAEAGIREVGLSDAQRLERAREWHLKACALAKRTPCAHADRLAKQLAAFKALTTHADRAAFWCADALDGAKHFTEASVTAPLVVQAACAPLFPTKFARDLQAIAGAPHDPAIRQPMLLVMVQEDICPSLATKPPTCTPARNPDKLSPEFRTKMISFIIKAALPPGLAERADELTAWLCR